MRSNIRCKKTECPKAGVQVAKVYFQTDTNSKGTRAKKTEMTVPAMKALNDKHSREAFELVVTNNFFARDLMLTLTFPFDLTEKERMGELNCFIRRLRNRYTKNGLELRYVYVSEYGEEEGKLHFHIIVNGALKFDEIQKLWKKSRKLKGLGNVHVENLKIDEHGLIALSYYLEKQWKTAVPYKRKWSGSRNLERPVESIDDDLVSIEDYQKICESTCPADLKKIVEKLFGDYQLLNYDIGFEKLYNEVTGSYHIKFVMIEKSKANQYVGRNYVPLVQNSVDFWSNSSFHVVSSKPDGSPLVDMKYPEFYGVISHAKCVTGQSELVDTNRLASVL